MIWQCVVLCSKRFDAALVRSAQGIIAACWLAQMGNIENDVNCQVLIRRMFL